jgi:hypothetical protein
MNHDKVHPTLDPDREMDIFSFHLAQLIDVLDSVDGWSEAEVMTKNLLLFSQFKCLDLINIIFLCHY